MADPSERDSAGLSLDQMMLADRLDGARLPAVLALAVSNDQPHFLTDIQVLERSVHHAVPVEVDLVAQVSMKPYPSSRDSRTTVPWTATSCVFTWPVVLRT